MPFTFSHPAIILVFGFLPKKHLSWTGLIVGTLTPDFEYFLRMTVQSEYSHTVYGLFYFDLPLGILLAFLYHNFVKVSLVQNLPQILKSRLLVFNLFDWNIFFRKRYILVCVSIVIGAVSHLLWDSFTHYNGFFVSQISMLRTNLEIINFQVPIFKILQHSSTLIGAIIITFTILKLPINQTLSKKINIQYWVVWLLVSFIIVISRFITNLDDLNLGNLIVTLISAGLFSFILTALILNKINIKTQLP